MAVGATIGARAVGSIADLTTFSFHPVKIVTTAEGGAATTQDRRLAQRMELFRSHGVTRDETLYEGASHGPWYYQQVELGLNYRMTDLQAALALSQPAANDAASVAITVSPAPVTSKTSRASRTEGWATKAPRLRFSSTRWRWDRARSAARTMVRLMP